MTTQLVIATPAYDGKVLIGFTYALLHIKELLARAGVRVRWVAMSSESLIQRARANLVAQFMTDAVGTHLLFIDADIVWDPRDVLRLIEHDLDVVCGAYRSKCEDVRFNVVPLARADGSGILCARTGCLEVDLAATGFMLIKRQVFERLAEAYPQSKIGCMGGYTERNLRWLFDWFPVYIDDYGVFLSEDYGFCRRWREIGGQVWCDPDVNLQHYGTRIFSGALRDVMQPAPAAA